MNVTILSGGVGGARFVCGLADVVGPTAVSVIGNVGDDVEVLGLHVSPDLDSILYALAGVLVFWGVQVSVSPADMPLASSMMTLP